MEAKTMTTERRGYTVDEVCRLYGLSRAHVYQQMAMGELPSIKIGKSRRILADHLATWEKRLQRSA